jgi:AmiR/NasT family two-component response regulator
MRLLITCTDEPAALAEAQGWSTRLVDAGLPVAATLPCHLLVREVVRLAPAAVLVVAPQLDANLRQALALLASTAPCPVLLAGAPPADADLPALLDLHLMAWLPADAPAASLAPVLALALAQFRRDRAQQQALAGALARLDERKWVDKAKGVLMRAQQLDEENAFRLLRTTSMQANLRVGEVARSLVEAARLAEAINRAGQLRMLSQRHVKALALRTDGRGRADDLVTDTAQRIKAHLAWLGAQTLPAPAAAPLADVHAAWAPLQRAAAAAALPSPDQLQQADAMAEQLLASADALTAALESGGGRAPMHVVNRSGRQRMRVQRLAKQALLATLLPPPLDLAWADAAAQTLRDFEAALVELEQAPLSSEAIRAALAQARGQWQRLRESLRRCDGPGAAAGRAAVARDSEALADSLDQLTQLYEHSMQILLG